MCKYIFNYPELLHTFVCINTHILCRYKHIYTYPLYVVFRSAYLEIKMVKLSVLIRVLLVLKVRGLVNLYFLVFLPEQRQ